MKDVKPTKDRPIRRIFITGFLALLPLVITAYILKILYTIIVSNLMPIFNRAVHVYKIDLPESLMGVLTVILFLVIIFLIGLLTRMYIGRLLIKLMESTVSTIPFVKSIYNAIKQMIDSFSASTDNFEKVVLVNFPHNDAYCVGFVVRSSQPLINKVLGVECYNVFVPTAPNPTSGFIAIIPIQDCKELDISIEEGVKFIISVGLINTNSLNDIV